MNDIDLRYSMQQKHTMDKFYNAISKGLVDEMLIPYLKKYNLNLINTYTTSSCAGRILILGQDSESQKKPDLFVGKWHRTIKVREALDLLSNDKFDELWLKQEPFIFHIVAKNLETAAKILEAKALSGIKRGGIINLKDGRIVIEIIGSSYMSVPVKINKEILFNKKQLSVLIKKANHKVKVNYKQMWKFLKILYKEMKRKN